MQYNIAFDTSQLTFITTANNLYINFVEPFIYFCKASNPGCKIEIWVDDPNAVAHINDSNVRIHQLPTNYHVATYRYIVTPTYKTRHYYITDIDIMHTELIQPFHALQMQQTGLPFSNVVRTKKGTNSAERMSGLHFVKDEWYHATRNIRPSIEPKGQDEEMLYLITSKVYDVKAIPRGLANRPVQGMHCSVGRNPREKVAWELTSQRTAFIQEHIIKSKTTFNEFFEKNVVRPLLSDKVIDKLKKRGKITCYLK